MNWERFFLLILLASPVMATAWLLWVILPSGIAYVLAIMVSGVVAWCGRVFHDEALRDAKIRNGRWPI